MVEQLLLELATVATEGFELVDELIDHIPEPLVGQLQLDGTTGGRVQDVVEEIAVVFKRLNTMLQRGQHVRVDVSVVQFLVQDEEHGVFGGGGEMGRGGDKGEQGDVTRGDVDR